MKWHDCLMKARLTNPPSRYNRITFQWERTDRFFIELGNQTHSGIQIIVTGRLIEKSLKECMFDTEVLHYLQPLPLTSGSSIKKTTNVRSQPYKAGNGKGKFQSDTGKGKGAASDGSRSMPQEMVALGYRASINSGQPICYNFSLGRYKNKPVKGCCDRAYHVYAIPGCGAHYAAKDCPEKNQGS